MKRKVSNILIILLFLVGIGILVYPTVSNQWNTYRQNKLIKSYQQEIKALEPEDFTKAKEAARKYNETIYENTLYADIYDEEEFKIEETEYWKILNLAGDGVMGYISIPKINVTLSIYHGTNEDVLQTGVGHVSSTKLPIGGENNHTVLAAHRGLPSARLFTDIDQLVIGDMIYLHILDEVLAYKVDQILDMVDKNDVDALASALKIEEGQDYVTLFTCTPYGVNSHRLLVRGTRVEYNVEEKKADITVPETMVEIVQDYYMLYLILALAIITVVVLIMKIIFNKKNKKTRP